MGSQPISLYGSQSQSRPEALIDRLKRYSNDDDSDDSSEAVLDSACTQLETFENEEFVKFQDLLIRSIFLDDDFGKNKDAVKVWTGLLYYIISVVDLAAIEDYFELMLRTCSIMPIAVAIRIQPLMFKAIVDKLRPDKLNCSALFSDKDITRFATVFAMELGSTNPEENAFHDYSHFWKATFDIYSTETCDSFDLKVFFVFLASKEYVRLYLQKSHENRIKLYQCLVRVMEKKPNHITVKMGCLLLMYIGDLSFNEMDWKNVALYIRKLHGCSSHMQSSAAVRNLVSRTITVFLRHARAPREDCIEKLQNQLKLPTVDDSSKKYASDTKPALQKVDQQHEEAARYTDLLQKLARKMKASGVRITCDSDRQKLKAVVRDLQSFL